MSLTVTLEAGAAIMVIISGFGAFVVWAVRRLLQAGAWFSAISANTAASKDQEAAINNNSHEIALSRTATTELRLEMAEVKTMVYDIRRRLGIVEGKVDATNDKIDRT